MIINNSKILTITEAKEGTYSEISLNLCVGCTHGCTYCFGPVAVHRTRESFRTGVEFKKDMETRLTSDCKKLKAAGYTGRVLLSHITDPYQPAEMEMGVTRKALEILNASGINFQILTKGGTRACRDFDLYKPGDSFAVTLTTLDAAKTSSTEPGAPPPIDRVEALRRAAAAGIDTWISMEPVIWTADSFAVIEATHEYAGRYIIGPINHDKALSDAVDWLKYSRDVAALLDRHGKSYRFNNNMRRVLSRLS